MKNFLRDQVLNTCRHILSEINRDPATDTLGCCDRRYWAWKLTDFPEATFQRNVFPLTWYADQMEAQQYKKSIFRTIISGLLYAMQIQHRDGSFDQAYPNEHSYGATGFLLPALLSAYQKAQKYCREDEKAAILSGLQKSAKHLLRYEEQHEFISNHLAGAALGLFLAGSLFGKDEYIKVAEKIVGRIISHQSDEGWFEEYGGADPGYQTLCMYYLARIYQISPDERLRQSLESSLDFLKYFVHPDGSFGGEYGSRRTEIYYPGGIALLSGEFAAAKSMHRYMIDAIENGKTITLLDIDMGNTAPLLSNYIAALEIPISSEIKRNNLPIDDAHFQNVFPEAGISIFASPKYYCVIGASNGGVIKLFSKERKSLVLDDCGLLGKTVDGKMVSSQITNTEYIFHLDEDTNTASFESPLFIIDTPLPNPLNFVLLRLLNLTLMRMRFINEWIKKILVRKLIRRDTKVTIKRKRCIQFADDKITISDEISKTGSIKLQSLSVGGKFSSIHMASARYFTPGQLDAISALKIDTEKFNGNSGITVTRTIDLREKEVENHP